jgi:membrane protease YdiL (CAAX protease family)
LSAQRIREVAGTVRAPSLRLLPNADAREDASAWSVPLWFPLVAVALMLVGPWLVADLWQRMLLLEGCLVGALLWLRPPLRLWAKPREVPAGVLTTVAMLAAAFAVVQGLRFVAPELIAGANEVYGWASTWPPLVTAALLPVVAGAEDLVWRFGITLGLVRRLGPAGAVAAGAVAFALAHATTGPPVLALAALLAGAVWSALAVRTRSWPIVLACHVVWDASMVWLAP